ncbi:peptidase family M1-domain-containing protein [Peziza echinospora]|nr:peptidase family M1-domain-containing protein [Peziza echinospora]
MASSTVRNPRTNDPATQANTRDFITKSSKLNYEVSFEKKNIEGFVEHQLEAISGEEEGVVRDEIWLDTSHLHIEEISIGEEVLEQATDLEAAEKGWKVAERVEPYGSKLIVKLGRVADKGEVIVLKIQFKTTAQCTALGWMDPEQTSNKESPYMYSQCQAIHARSLFPCQDTPAVKATYKSIVRSPLPVVTSAISVSTHSSGSGLLEYEFVQKIPIPSYLYAIASGDITSARIGPRSLLWTGPDELERCKVELSGDTEKFIEAAEKIIYPYPWETYNVLILPPSFPYGGMENPNMTFATPTIISGDKSNIDVIAHELAHSWSGNLVTNSSWQDFWLNEGWTTYLERRIQGEVHGEKMFHFSAIIGWKALKESIELYGADHEFTKLVINLEGKDPDDAFSSVPYEKGFNFLYFLDTVVGREKWNTFIPHYFTKFHQKSLTSDEFKETLLEFFAPDAEATEALTKQVNWERWFYGTGLPTPPPSFDTTLAEGCYTLANQWQTLLSIPPTSEPSADEESSRFIPHLSDIEGWSSGQIVVFLERVSDFPTPLGPELTNLMGATYGFASSANAEIISRFFTVGLKSRDIQLYEPTAAWLGTVGRMKFVRPLYRLLNECDRALAVRTFQKHQGFYHPICRDIVKKDLKLEVYNL